MILAIIVVVLCVLSFPLSVLLAYLIEPDSPAGPPPGRSRSKWELDFLSRHGDQHGE